MEGVAVLSLIRPACQDLFFNLQRRRYLFVNRPWPNPPDLWLSPVNPEKVQTCFYYGVSYKTSLKNHNKMKLLKWELVLWAGIQWDVEERTIWIHCVTTREAVSL